MVLDVTHGVTWESVFDAGFRPYYIQEGNFSCNQLDVDLSIRFADCEKILHLGRGDANFEILDKHTVVLFSFYGRENRTIDEARKKSEDFTQIFKGSIEITAKLSESDVIHNMDYSGKKLILLK